MAKHADAFDLDRDFEDFLGSEGMKTVIDWIAARSLWVDPRVVARVPVVFPKTRRKRHDEKRGDIVDGIRLGTNVPAQHAFWYARNDDPKAYLRPYVCHLYDGSPYFPEHNTHLANLTVFPRAIQSMSEWAPVQSVLHWHAWKRYSYAGPTGEPPVAPQYYPSTWPGVAEHSADELEAIVTRLEHLRARRPMHTNPAGPNATKMGVTQRAILDVLRDSPNGLTRVEVAKLIERSDEQVYQALHKLIQKNLVEKRHDPTRPGRNRFFAKEGTEEADGPGDPF